MGAIVGPVAAAAAQAATAAIQADAQKHVAATAAHAAIAQTTIQANTTMALSMNQMMMAQQNLLATKELFMAKEKGSMERMQIQLGALAGEQAAQRDERKEIRAMEQYRYDQQLTLVREQVNAQFKLAKYAANMQALQLALGGGAIGTVTSQLTASAIPVNATSTSLLASGGRGAIGFLSATTPSLSHSGGASRGVASVPNRLLSGVSSSSRGVSLIGRLAAGSSRHLKRVLAPVVPVAAPRQMATLVGAENERAIVAISSTPSHGGRHARRTLND